MRVLLLFTNTAFKSVLQDTKVCIMLAADIEPGIIHC